MLVKDVTYIGKKNFNGQLMNSQELMQREIENDVIIGGLKIQNNHAIITRNDDCFQIEGFNEQCYEDILING